MLQTVVKVRGQIIKDFISTGAWQIERGRKKRGRDEFTLFNLEMDSTFNPCTQNTLKILRGVWQTLNHCDGMSGSSFFLQLYLFLRDSIERRAVRVVETKLLDPLGLLSLRKEKSSLYVFYRVHKGKSSNAHFELVSSSRFYHRTFRKWNRAF